MEDVCGKLLQTLAVKKEKLDLQRARQIFVDLNICILISRFMTRDLTPCRGSVGILGSDFVSELQLYPPPAQDFQFLTKDAHTCTYRMEAMLGMAVLRYVLCNGMSTR